MSKRVDIFGLAGFTLSGCFFVASALRTGDVFALAGSIVWITSCLGWITSLLLGPRARPDQRSVTDTEQPNVPPHRGA